MPINRSALKRERQNISRRARNRIIKSKVHTSFINLEEALEAKNKDEIEKRFNVYKSVIDKAVKRGVFHKNKGSRNKSRMSKPLAFCHPHGLTTM